MMGTTDRTGGERGIDAIMRGQGRGIAYESVIKLSWYTAEVVR